MASRLSRLTLRTNFVLLCTFAGFVLTIGAILVFSAISVAGQATDRTVAVGSAQRLHILNDMYHDQTMAVVERAYASYLERDQEVLVDTAAELQAVIAGIGENYAESSNLDLPDETDEQMRIAQGLLSGYAHLAVGTVTGFSTAPATAKVQLTEFRQRFAEVAVSLQQITDTLTESVREAQVASARARQTAATVIFATFASTLLLLVAASAHISRTIRFSLAKVDGVAAAISSGNLTARTAHLPNDVIGELGASVDRMAGSLQATMESLEYNRARSVFGGELTSALEMVDTEVDVHLTIARAMTAVGSDARMEMLLADSSDAKLESAVRHPVNGAPSCNVESPFGCVAVRRGAPVVFATSEDLDVCPRLIDRPDGPCSAVCVPVAFMGRAIGVLHVTAGPDHPPASETVERLKALAAAAGSRIGTVRAFDASQRQAATDPLTNLLNRRSFEAEVGSLIRRGMPLSLAMVDLDSFKWLNDNHGHETGDRVLKMFSRVLKATVRDIDVVARWGGEEFAIVFSNVNAHIAAEALERVRATLAVEAANGDLPAVTASFGVADSTMSPLLEDMIRIADRALYAAKDAGRDCVRLGRSSDAARTDRPRHDTTAQVDPAQLVGH